MMREFKFRAYDKKNNEMYYSDNLPDIFFFGHDGKNKMYLSNSVWDKDEQTYYSDTISTDVMQFTGLYDADGKEIYEGDILQIKDSFVMWSRTNGQIVEDVNVVVEWSGCGFRPRRLGNTRLWILDMEQYEVIGNIYENPELLEEVMK